MGSLSYFVVQQSSNFCLLHFSNKDNYFILQKPPRAAKSFKTQKLVDVLITRKKKVILCTPCAHPSAPGYPLEKMKGNSENHCTAMNITVGQLDTVNQIWKIVCLILHNDWTSRPSCISSQVKILSCYQHLTLLCQRTS